MVTCYDSKHKKFQPECDAQVPAKLSPPWAGHGSLPGTGLGPRCSPTAALRRQSTPSAPLFSPLLS